MCVDYLLTIRACHFRPETMDTTLEGELYLAVHNGQLIRLRELLEFFNPASQHTDEPSDKRLKLENDPKESFCYDLLITAITQKDHQIVEVLASSGFNVNVEPNSSSIPPLHKAIEVGCIEAINVLLRHGADINTINGVGLHSALHRAVIEGNQGIVEILLHNGAKTNDTCRLAHTPLYDAVENEKMEIVRLLLANGADANCKVAVGRKNSWEEMNWLTPLYKAIAGGNADMVELLLDSRADPKRVSNKTNGFICAAQMGHLNIVQLLLNRQTDINTVDAEGCTALQRAIENQHKVIFDYLLDNNAAIEIEGNRMSCIHTAASVGSVDMIERLLEFGADSDQRCREFKTPLMYAAEKGHKGAIDVLLENGAILTKFDINCMSPIDFAINSENEELATFLLNVMINDLELEDEAVLSCVYRALNRASGAGYVKIIEIITKYLEAKNDDNESESEESEEAASDEGEMESNGDGSEESGDEDDSDRYSGDHMFPLVCAAEEGQLEVLKLLLSKKGSSVNASERGGSTLLHSASYGGHVETVKFLLDKGASVHKVSMFNRTPLHSACDSMESTMQKRMEIVKLLIERGIDLDAVDDEKKTAMHCALENAYLEIGILLIDHGADFNAVCKNGNTVMDLALEYYLIEGVKLLVKAMVKRKILAGEEISEHNMELIQENPELLEVFNQHERELSAE